MSDNKEKKSLWQEFNDMGGMPLWMYLVCSAIIFTVVFTGSLGSDITAFVAVSFAIAILFNKIGKILPIWNTYIGGGLLMGIDRNRIAVGGHSAGGNLTAAIILMSIDRGTFVPALQILDYGVFDNKTPAVDRRNGTANPKLPPWKSDFYQKMYVDPEDAEEIYCSPGLSSDAQLAKMPPTLMIYCESDMFCDEAARLQSRLLAAGVPVYGRRFLHSSHGFVVQRRDEFEEAEKMILTALREMM